MFESHPHALNFHFDGATHDRGTALYVDTRSGANVPQFRDKISRGQDCTTSYSLTRTNVLANVPGVWGEDFTNFGTAFSGTAYGNGVSLPSFVDARAYAPAAAQNAAKDEFVRRARGKMTMVQTGVIGAELHKTAQQVRRPAAALRDSISQHQENVKIRLQNEARRIRLGRKAFKQPIVYDKLQRVVQSSYLEWVFGASPLIHDVKDAAKAVSRLVNGFSPTEYVQGSQEWAVLNPSPFGKTTTYKSLTLGQGAVQFDRTSTASGKIRYCGGIRASVLADSSSILGLSLPNFVPSLWEWLPYSWLVDYFTNTSEILDALTFNTAGLAWNCVSERAVMRFDYVGTSAQTPDNGAGYVVKRRYGFNSVVAVEHVVYNRSPIPAFGLVPSVHFGIPDFGQTLNIAAVVLQRKTPISFVQKLIKSLF